MPTSAPAPVTFDLDSLDTLRHSRPRGMVSLGRFLRRFGYSAEQLEHLSRMPPGSAHANPFAARLQRFMGAALDIVALRLLRSRDLDEAIAWFKEQALDQFGGRTAETMVADGHGTALGHALRGNASPSGVQAPRNSGGMVNS